MAALVMVLVTGCLGGEPDELCEAAGIELGDTFDAAAPDTPCTADDECTFSERLDPRCPDDGARFEWCPLAVHVDDLAAIDGALSTALDDVCPRIPRDCRNTASCSDTRLALCVDGHCASLEPSTHCRRRCTECFAATSCHDYCRRAQDCIIAAESCDAIEACAFPDDAG